MNITAEAIQAAAKAYRLKVEWIDRYSRDDYGQETELAIRAALEAAAPHMLRPAGIDDDQMRRIPTYQDCATCDGGGCGDCI